MPTAQLSLVQMKLVPEEYRYIYEYAKMRMLDINYDKTKILIFGRRNNGHFNFNR